MYVLWVYLNVVRVMPLIGNRNLSSFLFCSLSLVLVWSWESMSWIQVWLKHSVLSEEGGCWYKFRLMCGLRKKYKLMCIDRLCLYRNVNARMLHCWELCVLMSVQWCFIHWDAEESRSVVLRFFAVVHAAGAEVADPLSSTGRTHQCCRSYF